MWTTFRHKVDNWVIVPAGAYESAGLENTALSSFISFLVLHLVG